MRTKLTLEYWRDADFYVGRLVEVPGVFSQGESLEELKENIQDAYDVMVTQEREPAPAEAQTQLVELEVWRQALIRELEFAGCILVRHGKRHDVYRNPATGQQAPVPRHREIAETLCKVIRKQLGFLEL